MQTTKPQDSNNELQTPAHLELLTPEERIVLRRRFQVPMLRLDDIGEELKKSREKVHAILRLAIRKIEARVRNLTPKERVVLIGRYVRPVKWIKEIAKQIGVSSEGVVEILRSARQKMFFEGTPAEGLIGIQTLKTSI